MKYCRASAVCLIAFLLAFAAFAIPPDRAAVLDWFDREIYGTIPLHLDGSDGRVFLVADRPLAPLAAKITHGADGVAVEVTSPDADVMIPIRVARVNAKPYYGVVKGGRWRHVFAAGEEVAAVTNLADGQGIAP